MAGISLIDFLNSPEGELLGGLDAGYRTVTDIMADQYGIDLPATLIRACGTEMPADTARVKARDVVFFNRRGNDYANNLYFFYDPSPQDRDREQSFDMPNITVTSFSGIVDKDVVSSFLEIMPLYNEFKESHKNRSTSEINKASRERAEKNRERRERERQERERRQREEVKKQEERKKKQADASKKTWDESRRAVDSNSPYFEKKGMSDIHEMVSLRRGHSFERLAGNEGQWMEFDMVPLYRFTKNGMQMSNYQKIRRDGQGDERKLFAAGLEPTGVFAILGAGNPPDGKILSETPRIHFAEGLATTYKVQKMTGDPCVFCLNASNLVDVVESFRRRYPEKDFVVAADNDAHKEHANNVGIQKAMQCAVEHDAVVTFPRFESEDNYREMTDWDDYFDLYSREKALHHYLSPENTINLKGKNREQRMFYDDVFAVRCASNNKVWDQVENMLLPEGSRTDPRTFAFRFSALSRHIPETAFREKVGEEVVDGKKIRNYRNLQGLRISEMSFDQLVGHKDIAKSLDINTASFLKDNLSEYIEKNRDAILEAGEKYEGRNKKSSPQIRQNSHTFDLDHKNSIEALSQNIAKGKQAKVKTESKYIERATLKFYFSNIDYHKGENGKAVIDDFMDINSSSGHSIEIFTLAQKVKNTFWVAVGDGVSPISEIMKKVDSNHATQKPHEVVGVMWGDKDVTDHCEISESAMNQIRAAYRKGVVQRETGVEKSRENPFRISELTIEETPSQNYKKEPYSVNSGEKKRDKALSPSP